jgi:deoxyribodipyrimidine photo-lyase
MSTHKNSLVVYWSRRDFRLRDNPALFSALKESKDNHTPFLPVFIFEPYMTAGSSAFQFGYPSRMFLAKAVPAFAKLFDVFSILHGKPTHVFKSLASHYNVTIYVNEDIHPDFYAQVKKITEAGISIKILKDALTVDRETKTDQGNYYSVFTPFKKKVWTEFVVTKTKPNVSLQEVLYAEPKEVFHSVTTIEQVPASEDSCIEMFSSKRTLKVGKHEIDLQSVSEPFQNTFSYTTETEALEIFNAYVHSGNMALYKENRDSLEKDTETLTIKEITLEGKTSRMSLALAWGLVSPRTLKEYISDHFKDAFLDPYKLSSNQGALIYLSELIWREFYKYLYYHNPKLSDIEFQEKFRGTIEWVPDSLAHERFIAWIQGETGYPVVDAAMKQLARTGWMHNRSRMIVASILTKNFGVDWRWGQEYFRATLIDLDEASNNGGWQWGASVGADPKPIRIFNPMLQAKNYDESGAYQRKWLGKYRNIPVLIEHTIARDEALERYKLSKESIRDY